MDLANEIKCIENTNLSTILTKLYALILEKDGEILELRNKVTNLEERITEQEIYSSKDSINLENLLLNHSKESLSEQVCLFEKFLGYKTFPSRFKACHRLGPGSSNKPAAVIVKFIFFDEKNELYGRKSWLANQKNPIDGRKIFLIERLPPCQKEILDHA